MKKHAFAIGLCLVMLLSGCGKAVSVYEVPINTEAVELMELSPDTQRTGDLPHNSF